jgi:hypothetical protein
MKVDISAIKQAAQRISKLKDEVSAARSIADTAAAPEELEDKILYTRFRS